MLTKSERLWLKRRKIHGWCIHCRYLEDCNESDCTLSPDLEDALEFSERVTVKLAELCANLTLPGNIMDFDCENVCPAFSMCCCTTLHEDLSCDDTILMYARLQVEEEMDNGT